MTISRDRIHEGYECDCDGAGCTEWQAFHVTSVAAMRRRLEGAGWRTIEGQHFCPGCVKREAQRQEQRRLAVDMKRIGKYR